MVKKIISSAIIFLMIFGLINNIFIKKSEAQKMNVGEAFGKAVASFAVCWVVEKLSLYIQGLATDETVGAVAGAVRVGEFFFTVPAVEVGGPITEGKAQSNEAYNTAKNCLRDTFIKIMGDYVVDQVVDWIQNGGSLGDRFVTDWGKFKDDAFNVGVGTVINESNFKFLCAPFGLQIKLAFMPVQKFSKQITCTLDKIVKNIDNFYIDFSVGDWEGYLASWEPQNNYYGSILLFNDEAIIQGNKAKEDAVNDANAGGGFLSIKRCKDGGEDSLAMARFKYKKEWQFSKTSNGYCPRKLVENTTPGGLVKDKISRWTVDRDFYGLINSKDIAVWTQAIVDAAINRLLKEGLAQMQPDDEDDFDETTYQDNLLTATNEVARDALRGVANKARVINGIASQILPIKQQSLITATNNVNVLQSIAAKQTQTPGACLPNIAQTDIDAAINVQDSLNKQVSNLTNITSVISNLLNFADNNQTADANTIAANIESYNNLLAKYPDEIRLLSDLSVLTTVNQELSDISGKLNSAQSQFASCGLIIAINNGAAITVSQNVSLTINSSGSNISNVSEMMISNDASFSGAVWEPYAVSKSWTLTASAGLKTVYVRFRNSLGNVSNTFSDDITLQ